MTTVKLYGAEWCASTARVRRFLQENGIPFEDINIDISPGAKQMLEKARHDKQAFPIVWIEDQELTDPDDETLAAALGVNPGYRVQMFGAEWCPDCKRAKAFLKENDVHYQYLDIDRLDWAPAELERLNNGKRIVPTLIVNGKAYANPGNRTIRQVLGLSGSDNRKVYDVAIIGGGATGLTAAIYVQRDRFESIILERKTVGGNASLTEKIENYPGFINISGPELMEKMAEQARFYGAEIREGAEVRGFDKSSEYFTVDTTDGEIKARSIIVATGSTYRRLNVPGEEELLGSGVHFCATCDGAFYKNRRVAVIGGGNSALEEGIFLTRFADRVKIIGNKPEFSASAAYLDKLPSIPAIETYRNKTTLAFETSPAGAFRGVRIKDNKTGEEEVVEADGAFVFVGLRPNTGFLKNILKLDDHGFVWTEPGSVQTSMEGVLAAGDVRRGAIAQVAAAAGEGVIASYFVKNYLREHQ